MNNPSTHRRSVIKDYFLWLAKFLTLVFVIFFIVPLFLIGALVATQDSLKSTKLDQDGSVAVVELDDVILDSKKIVKKLHKQIEKENVKGVVLRINSPGGAVGPSQDIYSAVKRLKEKKPIVASMSAVAASGGLYSALGASKIYAQPGTITGSIGVIVQIPNLTTIADKVGFKMVTVKSGKLKDVGNTFREMTPEEKKYLQSFVDDAHSDFVKAVSEGRDIELEKVKAFADGRIILGSRAKEIGLIDEIGDLYAAARAVHELSGDPLDEGEVPKLFYPEDPFDEFRQFFDAILSWLPRSEKRISLQYLMQ